MTDDGGRKLGPGPSGSMRGTLKRGRSTFATKTAQDDGQLSRRFSTSLPQESRPLLQPSNGRPDRSPNQNQTAYGALQRSTQGHSSATSLLGNWYNTFAKYLGIGGRNKEASSRADNIKPVGQHGLEGEAGPGASPFDDKSRRRSETPRISGDTEKLGTFSGVFVPTTLNVLSILMFIRFGFILGQTGLLGMMGLMVLAYAINLVTTLSISAIASNGTVRGGGAYYLISRSLGPEFGGSIGIVFFLGFVFNTGMNAVAVADVLFQNFGTKSGDWANFLPEGGLGFQYLWATVVLLLCTGICLAGSSIFARASNGLLIILLIATFSIPASALVLSPFVKQERNLEFTGLSLQTLKQNLLPRFTKHAAGSQLHTRENYQDLFGILFPATGGIFAGASMSGDLQNPSKSIPKGTLYGLGLTFVAYTLVIVAMAASITRASLYSNVNVIQDTNISEILVFLGELATTLFSTLMGIIGPAKLLQAIARDNLIPGLGIFSQGTKTNDEPIYAIVLTLLVSQITIVFDLNRLALAVTMAYLMTFFATNLACFLLEISSAPNFRPSFHYFNRWTAAAGTLLSVAAMFYTDGLYAGACILSILLVFSIIHFTTTPRSWGDVSQALIYHQLRKYLLRLRPEHVKFWRPQILLFVNDPHRGYKLIHFCNSLKKGGLYILGHVIVTSDFGSAVPEARRQQTAWTKFVELSKIKAFINVAISPGVEWGARNIVLSAGLGGMRPNIVVLGSYNLEAYYMSQSIPELAQGTSETWNLDAIDQEQQPQKRKKRTASGSTSKVNPDETYRSEGLQNIQSYLTILEDMLLKLRINVAIAKGFKGLEVPKAQGKNTKKYIDLWPIQMSAEFAGEGTQSLLTTNFDTYTLVLQLGCILTTVPSYKRVYSLRIIVFVEYESEVESERSRVTALLETLRIQATVLVFWLASGEVKSYQIIVNGTESEDSEANDRLETILKDEEWWAEIKEARQNLKQSASVGINQAETLLNHAPAWPAASFQQSRKDDEHRFDGLRQLVSVAKRRRSISSLSTMGVSLGMRTHRLHDDLLDLHASASEASDTSDSDFDRYSSNEDSDGEGSAAVDVEDERPQSGTLSPSSHRTEASQTSSKRSSKGKRAKKLSLRKAAALMSATGSTATSPQLRPTVSDSSLNRPRPRHNFVFEDDNFCGLEDEQQHSNPQAETLASGSEEERRGNQIRDETPGPSIMFHEPPVPRREPSGDANAPSQSIYQRKTSMQSLRASGFPSAASLALSFNDLPCRAQHAILNELMVQHSKDTAVLFTTLPAPVEGTHKTEADCLSYLSDLEVLTEKLPPTLLVHSNSMTVTTNL